MDAFDFSLLQTDLQELEEKLQQYGSKPVKDEISLNQLLSTTWRPVGHVPERSSPLLLATRSLSINLLGCP